MSWNYRVIKKSINGEDTFAIHEVYYDENNKPEAVTTDSCCPMGETIKELEEDCEYYRIALDKPVLNYEDF